MSHENESEITVTSETPETKQLKRDQEVGQERRSTEDGKRLSEATERARAKGKIR